MKRGFIKIADILYRKEWNIIYILFKDFRPFHIEYKYWDNNVWYFHGESDLFDEIKEGEPIPQYDVLFTTEPDGTYTYKFERLRKEIINEPGS